MKELEEYLRFLQFQRNYSLATIKSYESDLLQFLEFCEREGISFL